MVMWPVCFQCRGLDVSRSGFYSWLRRVVSPRRERRKFLYQQILSVFMKHRKRAGRRQIHRNLTGDGVSVGLNTVGRIMREHAIRPWYCKPFRRPRRDKDRQNVKPNDLDRAFQPGMPNRAWLSDITEFRTFEGKLYLSVVEDLGTRRVLGWAMSNRMRAELVEESLQMAIKLRGKPVKVLFHSDQGSQFRSELIRHALRDYGADQSMSRRANCWDNAPMESFFATLKREMYWNRSWTRQRLRTEIFEFIEVYYNRQRLHSTLSYQTPVGFEKKAILKDPLS